MNKYPSLFRGLIHYLSGRAVLIFLGFFTFPLMTRILSVSAYGLVSLSFRLILLLTVLSKCGLQYSAARFYDADRTETSIDNQQRYYSTLLFGPLLTSFALVAIYFPILLSVQRAIPDVQLYRCLLIAPVLVLLRTLQSVQLSFLRNVGKSLLHSMLEVATKFVTLAALLALFFFGIRSAFSILVATAISEALIIFVQLGMLLHRDLIKPSAFDWSLVRTSLSFGAPLIAYELSSIVLDSGDRLLVLHYLSNVALGYYSAAYNISSYLQEMIMTPLNLAIVPIYIRLWNASGIEATQKFLSTALSWFIGFVFIVTFLSLIGSREALILLASPKFSKAGRLLPILIPSLMLYAMHIFLNVGLILKEKTAIMAGLVFISAIVNFGLNIILIPRLGLDGAAWANLWSYLVLILLLALVNQRFLPLQLHVGIIWKVACSSALAYIIASQIRIGAPFMGLALKTFTFTSLTVFLATVLSFEFRTMLFTSLRIAAQSIGCRTILEEVPATTSTTKVSIANSRGGES